MADPIGVISDADRGLTSRAQLALTDRMLRIAFQLFRQRHLRYTALAPAKHFCIAFHDARRHSTAGRTERANTGLPDRNSRDELIFGNEADKVIVGVTATGQGRAGTCERRKFYKAATVHVLNQ